MTGKADILLPKVFVEDGDNPEGHKVEFLIFFKYENVNLTSGLVLLKDMKLDKTNCCTRIQ